MSAIHISNELVESQKVRSDLLKWKLVVVATLAAVGLGVSDNFKQLELALCLIPFVSAYLDALCLHVSLRISAIGRWHMTDAAKNLGDDFAYMKMYEEFTSKATDCGAFNLERWTVLWSSILINSVLIAFSLASICNLTLQYQSIIFSSGAIGLILTLLLNHYFKLTKTKIESI